MKEAGAAGHGHERTRSRTELVAVLSHHGPHRTLHAPSPPTRQSHAPDVTDRNSTQKVQSL